MNISDTRAEMIMKVACIISFISWIPFTVALKEDDQITVLFLIISAFFAVLAGAIAYIKYKLRVKAESTKRYIIARSIALTSIVFCIIFAVSVVLIIILDEARIIDI